MFVVEISFNKEGQQSELVYVKRPHFIIGSSPSAHVIVDEMASLGYALHFVKGRGNSFLCYTLSSSELSSSELSNNEKNDANNALAETFYGNAKLDLTDVSLNITVIDNDLFLRQIDVNNKNILKNLRKATLTQVPVFPALVIFHEHLVIYSIEIATEILLGRSRDCHVRIDAEGVDNIHCKLMYENSKFWITDEMSTSGVFVDGEKITSRVGVAPCKYFSLGGSINIMGVISEEQLLKVSANELVISDLQEFEDVEKYPCIISHSSLARPSRMHIAPGKEISIGRAPENDIWIGSPYISRTHLRIYCDVKSEITLKDNSSNGSACDGVLITGDNFKISKSAHMIDLGDSIILGICYSKEDEDLFNSANDSVREFLNLIKAKEAQQKEKVKANKKIFSNFKKILNVYSNLDKKGKFGFCLVASLGIIFIILVVSLLVELFMS